MTPEDMLPPAFFQRRADGHRAEARVRRHLLEHGALASRRNGGKCLDLDVYMDGRSYWLEVKDESTYATSGNLCLELAQGEVRRPSGLSVTQAAIVLHILDDRAALYRAQPMRLYLKRRMAEGTLRPRVFRKADFQNCGIVLQIADVQNEPWFEVMSFSDLHLSRVWLYGETPTSNYRRPATVTEAADVQLSFEWVA